MKREDLQSLVASALADNGGKAAIAATAQHIWEHHEAELKASGDLFYTWQYDMRWAAQRLAKAGKLRYGKHDGKQVWELT